MRVLNEKKNMINYDQQDAQELYQLVSSTMTDELIKLSVHSPSLTDAFRSITFPTVRHTPFTGTLASRLACLNCGYSPPIRHFIFDAISLPLPMGSQTSTNLLDLLNSFVALESINDATCRKCSILSTYTLWSKQIKVPLSQERKGKKKKKKKKKKNKGFSTSSSGLNENSADQLRLQWLRSLLQTQEYEKEL
ncbi:hypothetical protein HMI55_005517, partial [Coelomomyces lativittatus]